MDKKSKGFLVLCFISALLIGTVISAILVLIMPIIGPTYFSIFIVVLVFIMLSAITYFSFSSFDIQEKTILFLTLPISIIISAITFIVDYAVKSFLESLQTEMITAGEGTGVVSSFGNVTSLFNINSMMNIWLLIALIIIIYNLPSIVFMLSKKEPQQQQLQ